MRSAHDEVRLRLDEIREIALNNPRIVMLADEVEVLTNAYLNIVGPRPWDGVHLTTLETRIAELLWAAEGRVIGPDHMNNAMYFDRHNESVGTPKVLILHIRKKLAGKCEITTHGSGYALAALGPWARDCDRRMARDYMWLASVSGAF